MIIKKKKTAEEEILELVSDQMIVEGGDFIIQELTWAMEDKEPFAEEKAAERKVVTEKKKKTKEFGEW